MKISFKRRFSSDIAFSVEIDDKHKNDSVRTQRGEAIKKAIKEKIDLSGSDLRGSNLSGSNLSGVPFIKDIHQTVYQAASVPPEALDMSTWHKCETTHCRAGWIVTLAGAGGAALEWALGTAAAAALIYIKSDPKLEKIPNFYATNEEALADMKRLADLEKGA